VINWNINGKQNGIIAPAIFKLLCFKPYRNATRTAEIAAFRLVFHLSYPVGVLRKIKGYCSHESFVQVRNSIPIEA